MSLISLIALGKGADAPIDITRYVEDYSFPNATLTPEGLDKQDAGETVAANDLNEVAWSVTLYLRDFATQTDLTAYVTRLSRVLSPWSRISLSEDDCLPGVTVIKQVQPSNRNPMGTQCRITFSGTRFAPWKGHATPFSVLCPLFGTVDLPFVPDGDMESDVTLAHTCEQATNAQWLGVRPLAYSPSVLKIGAFCGDAQTLATIDAFEALTGRHADYMMLFHTLASIPDADLLAALVARGTTPIVTLELTGYNNAAISGGTHDAAMTTWAAPVAAAGGPVVIRLMHEMNIDEYDWGYAHGGVSTGNTPTTYKTAFTHAVPVLRAAAPNALICWCPNKDGGSTGSTMSDYYPGDAYVDFLGLDGYSSNGDNFWTTFDSALTAIHAINATKPLIICETACKATTDGEAFMVDMFDDLPPHALSARWQQIVGVCWFNGADSTSDWRIDETPEKLAAFRKGSVLMSTAYDPIDDAYSGQSDGNAVGGYRSTALTLSGTPTIIAAAPSIDARDNMGMCLPVARVVASSGASVAYGASSVAPSLGSAYTELNPGNIIGGTALKALALGKMFVPVQDIQSLAGIGFGAVSYALSQSSGGSFTTIDYGSWYGQGFVATDERTVSVAVWLKALTTPEYLSIDSVLLAADGTTIASRTISSCALTAVAQRFEFVFDVPADVNPGDPLWCGFHTATHSARIEYVPSNAYAGGAMGSFTSRHPSGYDLRFEIGQQAFLRGNVSTPVYASGAGTVSVDALARIPLDDFASIVTTPLGAGEGVKFAAFDRIPYRANDSGLIGTSLAAHAQILGNRPGFAPGKVNRFVAAADLQASDEPTTMLIEGVSTDQWLDRTRAV